MSRRVGRKIYRANANYKKQKVLKAFKILFFIIILAALVFLGYCVARPVFDYLSDRNAENSSAENTAPWTPPVFEENGDEKADISEQGDTDSEEEKSEEKTSINNGFSAYRLPVSSLESDKTLKDALALVKEGGYTAVIAVLKDEGGKIYYKTGSELAKSDENAIVGNMYAGQICSIIKSEGFTPIAEVNLLEDNNRYGENRDGSYHFASDNSTWLDSSVANGGNRGCRLSIRTRQSYAAYLSNEVSGGGFEYIIFDGLTFPPFRNSDLNYIGSMVQSADRYKALINIENISVGAVNKEKTIPVVMTSAGEILDGKEEVFKPAEISSEMIAVSYVPSEISGTVIIGGQETAVSDMTAYERASAVFGEIKRLAGENKTIVPALRQSDFSQADFNDVITAAIELGMESYIIL